MKFGLLFRPQDPPEAANIGQRWQEILAAGETAEEAGWDGLFVPEHHMMPDAYLPSPCIQNHAANLAFLPDGTLTCVWFGGTMEGMGDISVYMSRLAPGADHRRHRGCRPAPRAAE